MKGLLLYYKQNLKNFDALGGADTMSNTNRIYIITGAQGVVKTQIAKMMFKKSQRVQLSSFCEDTILSNKKNRPIVFDGCTTSKKDIALFKNYSTMNTIAIREPYSRASKEHKMPDLVFIFQQEYIPLKRKRANRTIISVS